MADRTHPRVIVVHPDPALRDRIVAALSDRGHAVVVPQPRPAARFPDWPDPRLGDPAAAVVVADHTQLPLSTEGQILALVPTHEHTAILTAFVHGADDVLAGPLRPAELAARVGLLVRTPVESCRLSVGPIMIDVFTRRVTLAGRPIDLTPTEYDLLATLAAHPGRVFTKAELLHVTQPRATTRPPTESGRPNRRVDTHVTRLRRRLGDHRGLLVTVWGVGYRLG